jgi:GR25 family glycosyltransferase involved in LPS biosynthesis
MINTAICLFVYNRPHHTRQVLKSISDCKNFSKFQLYIFSDNFNKLKKKDELQVSLVRNEVSKFKKKNKNVLIKFFNINLGLYRNLTKGISYVLKKHASVIVLEDDLILKKNFLHFMHNSLEKFKNKKNILQISGYSYPVKSNTNNVYFLNLTSCWGWATWSDRWENFIKFSKNKKLIKKEYDDISSNDRKKDQFNVQGSYNYLKMLKKQITSKFNSWGILFYLFSFHKNFLNLFPPSTLVENRGFDGSGSHKSISNVFNQVVSKDKSKRIGYPRMNKLNNYNQKQVGIFLLKELGLVRKIMHYLFR